jgi:hypothetical protein
MTANLPDLDSILVIIPVLNEEATIAQVIHTLQTHGLTQIRVIDNGSSDRTAWVASEAGAEVISEPHRGYGMACWRGLQHLPAAVDWILFCDGDGSDDLTQLPDFLANRQDFDLILGDRRATAQGQAALTPIQNFGNGLATWLIRWGWGHCYRDLGPLRLISRHALEGLHMQDRGFGWTVEMQVRAIECQLRICEVPVSYRNRQGGRSKISGTLWGSAQAGWIILSTLGKLYQQKLRNEWGSQFQNPRQAIAEPIEPHPAKILRWFSALCLLLGAALMLPYGDFRQVEAVPHFWLGSGVMGLGFIASWQLRGITAAWFWGVAGITRLFLLPMYPGDDVWRYLWEGYLQNLGFSPYQFAPNAAELMPYRTEWWWMINHLDVSAIYPPIAQFGFRWLAAIAPTVIVFKIGFVIADLLTCWLLSRYFGYFKALLYAWNPLVIYAFAGGAHYDSWFILPLVAAWIVCDRTPDLSRWFWGAFLLGISAAMKWMSMPILGFVVWRALPQIGIRRSAIVLLIGCLPFGISALPFCHATSCPLVPTESVFVAYGRSAEFIPHLVGRGWAPSLEANSIYLFPLGLLFLWLLGRARNFLQFTEGYFFILLMLSPIIHAWYFTWLVPFAVASRNWGTRLVSLSAFVYFDLKYRQALGDGRWHLSDFTRLGLWLPLVLGCLWTVICLELQPKELSSHSHPALRFRRFSKREP